MINQAICADPSISHNAKISIHVKNGRKYAVADENGNCIVTGVFPNEDQSVTVWYEACEDEEPASWDEDTIPTEAEWEDERTTRHDITGNGDLQREVLSSLDVEQSGFDGYSEISGIHTIRAMALDEMQVGAHVKLIVVNRQKVAIQDLSGEYTVILVRKERDKRVVEVIMRSQDERLEQRQILERLARGRVCGVCGESRSDFIDDETQREFQELRRAKRRRVEEKKPKE